jgi:pre-mRNA-splicing factor SYF1
MDDTGFEADLAREPYSVPLWLSYASSLATPATARARFLVYERALARVPGSYKLWRRYLADRTRFAAAQQSDAERARSAAGLRALFERALVCMHRYPRVWEMYAAVIAEVGTVTETRTVYDRALRALPPTQHAKVWRGYLDYARGTGCAELLFSVHDRLAAIDKLRVGFWGFFWFLVFDVLVFRFWFCFYLHALQRNPPVFVCFVCFCFTSPSLSRAIFPLA